MKFSMFALMALLGIALANETVPLPEKDDEQCRQGQGLGDACCKYSDCKLCLFQERCCYKPGGVKASGRGACLCGVNSYPQGTCY